MGLDQKQRSWIGVYPNRIKYDIGLRLQWRGAANLKPTYFMASNGKFNDSDTAIF